MEHVIVTLPGHTHHWIPVVSWPLIGWAVAMHFQTNRWSDWAQIWWANSLWTSPSMINFWSCFTEFPLFAGPHWSSGFCGFPDKSLWGLLSNWVDPFIGAVIDIRIYMLTCGCPVSAECRYSQVIRMVIGYIRPMASAIRFLWYRQ